MVGSVVADNCANVVVKKVNFAGDCPSGIRLDARGGSNVRAADCSFAGVEGGPVVAVGASALARVLVSGASIGKKKGRVLRKTVTGGGLVKFE